MVSHDFHRLLTMRNALPHRSLESKNTEPLPMPCRPQTNPVHTWLTAAMAILAFLLSDTMALSQVQEAPSASTEEQAAETNGGGEGSEAASTGEDSTNANEGVEEYEEDGEYWDELGDDVEEESQYDDAEEITITGEATSGGTQGAPEAITTFDQQQLDSMGISNVDDLALSTPSLHVGQFGAKAMITLRGVGVENVTEIGDPGVVFEVDAIPMGRAIASNQTFFDLERVDVLRGPQGQDGGRQSTGGRIALRSKKAESETDVFGDFQYGSYDQFLTRVGLNVPILDEALMSRFTMVHEKRDGYQDNLLTGRKSDNADDADSLLTRFQLRSLLADESVELWGVGTYSMQKGHGPARNLLGPPPDQVEVWRLTAGRPEGLSATGGDAAPFLVRDSAGNNICPTPLLDNNGTDRSDWACNTLDPRTTYTNEIGEQDNSQGGFTGHATWDLPWLSTNAYFSDLRVKLVGGYMDTKQSEFFDVDSTNALDSFFDRQTEAQQGTFEAFLERPDVENFDFKLGVFYMHETVNTDFCYDSKGSAPGADLEAHQRLVNRSIATYANAGYRVLDNLRAKAGFRYTLEKKEAAQDNVDFVTRLGYQGTAPAEPDRTEGCTFKYRDYHNFQLPPPDGRNFPFQAGGREDIFFGNSTSSVEAEEEWSKVDPMFGFDWEVTEVSTLAFKFSTSFKAGGFPLGTVPGLDAALTQPYNAEEVMSYELNWKNEFFDSRLRLNVTGFWTDYDPYQFCQLAGPLYFCEADGSATSRGVEIEFNAEPVDRLTLNGHFNYLNAKLDDFNVEDPTSHDPNGTPVSNPPPTDVSGNFLPKAPEFSGSFGVQYALGAGRWGTFSPRAQLQGQSRTYFRVFNREEFSQEGFVKLDLSLDWVSEDERFSIRGFVNNVTDEDVLNFLFVGSPAFGGHVTGQYMAPRTWGVRLGVNYTNDLF